MMKVLLSLSAFMATAFAQDCAYDGTGDGVVDVQDLLGLLGEFGCGADAQAPWTYVGCFVDSGDRDLNGAGPSAVAQVPFDAANECAAACDGFAYFGLQWVNECFCDNEYGEQGERTAGECGELQDDGSASLCANGQGNCGWANAVYVIGGMGGGQDLDAFSPTQYSQAEIDAAGIENADLSYPVYSALISVDGMLTDWAGLPTLAQTPFRRGGTVGADANGATGGGDWCEFDEYNGGIHNGIDDQSMAFALAFDTTALYMGVKAFDDTHQNPGSGWNGDTLQIAFTNAARDAPSDDMILYNYGLHDDGGNTLHHERHPCPDADDCTDAAMERSEEQMLTIYEIQIPARGLGVDNFVDGMQMGFGMCLNDGDTEDGQGGQKGWTGWGPYSIVYGKNSPATGLITITGDSVELPNPDPQACGAPGSDNLAEPGPGHVLGDGEEVTYVQGTTNYVNCVWTSGCDGGWGSVAVSSFSTEANWDYLNLFSDVSLITNSIGPAANNGGVDNSGDLGRFSGNQAPGTVAGVAAVQYITDWSVQGPSAGVVFTHTCPSSWQYLGCFVDSGDRDLNGGASAVASVPIDAANECSETCSDFPYFGLQWVNECFCSNRYGTQGEADIADCDEDGALDADGTASLCANGQGNCGWRNAVYNNGPPAAIINLDQLDGVTATAGPGVNDRGAPETVIDMNHAPGDWTSSPTTDFADCTESAYMTINLGALYMVQGVTVWHYYGNDRAYCQQKICVSATGDFAGEGYCPFDTGEEDGPTESEDGIPFTFPPTVGQFVRHWSGRSTSNGGVHFMEIDVYGNAEPVEIVSLLGGATAILGTTVRTDNDDVVTEGCHAFGCGFHAQHGTSAEDQAPLLIDNDHSPGSWAQSPNGDSDDCSTRLYATVDLGDFYLVTGVTIWHYYGNTRAYCAQKVAISGSGDFRGEEITAYDSGGEEYGPDEQAEGNAFTFPATVGRFVRHWCGRSTSNGGIHMMEVDVYGMAAPVAAPPAPAAGWMYLGCFVDSGDRDVDMNDDSTMASAVASVPVNAANECAAACSMYPYFGLQWTNECFCGERYGNQGEADIADCDEDGALDADGTASLCANGQGNCGWRNAVYGTADTLSSWAPTQLSQDEINAAGVENADLSYNVKSALITLDAMLDDWNGIQILAQTPFRRGGTVGSDANGATGGGDWCEFDEYDGGIHNGVNDQSMAFALAFTSNFLYMGVKTFDDTHQNPGSGWNGDTLQIAFTNAARDAPSDDMILYNYGLSDSGDATLHHERHPCPDADECTDAAMARFGEDGTRAAMTIYEIAIPAVGLGVDSLAAGMQMGFGMCLNDGDTADGQGGQKGWTGWGPYSIVYGKNSAAAGLITISGDSIAIPMPDDRSACGAPGANNLAEPGAGHALTDGEAVEYVQGATDYTNCVWTSGCDGGVGSIEVTSFTSEGNWDYLNLFSDASLVTNSIGPAANNGGIDNSGDLGRFSGTQAPGTVAGVAAVQYISDWSYQEPGSNVAFTHTCPPVWSYLGCFVDSGDRDLNGGASAVASVPFDAAMECSETCTDYPYFGLQWVNECFCSDRYGTQGEADIADCDEDGALDSDGTASLCANGQGNCGWRNAVYDNGYTASLQDVVFTQKTQDQINAAGVENADLAYDVYPANILLDAMLDDWNGIPILAQTPFRRGGTVGADANGATGGGDWCEFDEYDGGIHNGIDDQSMAFALAWNSNTLFMGVKTIDDTHQNPGSGWNGDTLQIAFTNAARDAPSDDMVLYNYGLSDDGGSTLHHERHPCPDADDCTDAAMARFNDMSLTIYEIQIPARGLGLDNLFTGMQAGFGMCLNDGDTEDGQGGQKGWTGWGPYSIVYGKNSPAAGLMTLVGDSPPSAHWVACGSSANGCSAESPYLAVDTELHEVSCCNSEEGFSGVDGFDWRGPTGARADCSSGAWGMRRAGNNNNGCYGGGNDNAADYATAAAWCATGGGRLCTAAETNTDCTRGTGCSHDGDLLWTTSSGP